MNILKRFNVKLNQTQAEKIRREFQKAKASGAGMLVMQPVTTCGPFTLHNSILQCAVLSPECTAKLQEVLGTE